MIPFKTYIGELHSKHDWIDSDSTLLSNQAIENLLFEKKECDGCFIIPKNIISKSNNDNIRKYFKENRLPLYPVAVKNKNTHGRIYLTFKKPQTSSVDFKEFLSNSYYENKNFDLIYFTKNTIKILKNSKVSSLTEEKGIVLFEKLISEILEKKTSLVGLEIPINDDVKYYFTENNLLCYPLSNYDFKNSKNWKTILNG